MKYILYKVLIHCKADRIIYMRYKVDRMMYKHYNDV